eukprot:6392821-Pyramimonas_sp.AAC.1
MYVPVQQMREMVNRPSIVAAGGGEKSSRKTLTGTPSREARASSPRLLQVKKESVEDHAAAMAVSLGAMQPDQAAAMVGALRAMQPDQAEAMVDALATMEPDQ